MFFRGQKRKCETAAVHHGKCQNPTINTSPRRCSYNDEFEPTSQLDTYRKMSCKPHFGRVCNISTDMQPGAAVGGGVTRAASDRTVFIQEMKKATPKCSKVLLSRHSDLHQNTVASALAIDCKQDHSRNYEKEPSHDELSSRGSKWAQFVTPADDLDSSDSDANESGEQRFYSSRRKIFNATSSKFLPGR